MINNLKKIMMIAIAGCTMMNAWGGKNHGEVEFVEGKFIKYVAPQVDEREYGGDDEAQAYIADAYSNGFQSQGATVNTAQIMAKFGEFKGKFEYRLAEGVEIKLLGEDGCDLKECTFDLIGDDNKASELENRTLKFKINLNAKLKIEPNWNGQNVHYIKFFVAEGLGKFEPDFMSGGKVFDYKKVYNLCACVMKTKDSAGVDEVIDGGNEISAEALEEIRNISGKSVTFNVSASNN